MQRINQFAFFELGQLLERLKLEERGSVTSVSAFMPLVDARSALQSLLKGEPIPVSFSRTKAEKLHKTVAETFDRHFMREVDGLARFFYPDDEQMLKDWEVNVLNKDLRDFVTVFAEEMREAATYFVPRRGIYYTPALVDSADEYFPLELRHVIPQKSKDDWKAAGRCLAFNLLSASGFHVTRAIEGMLEKYFQHFCDKPDVVKKSWHDYIVELEKVASESGPTAKVIAQIKQIKDDFRNPIAHPRIVLSESDAHQLFGSGAAIIIGMAQEVQKATLGVGQSALSFLPFAPPIAMSN